MVCVRTLRRLDARATRRRTRISAKQRRCMPSVTRSASKWHVPSRPCLAHILKRFASSALVLQEDLRRQLAREVREREAQKKADERFERLTGQLVAEVRCGRCTCAAALSRADAHRPMPGQTRLGTRRKGHPGIVSLPAWYSHSASRSRPACYPSPQHTQHGIPNGMESLLPALTSALRAPIGTGGEQ